MSLAIKKSFSGKGLFATRDFRKGEFIIEYFGPVIEGDDIDRYTRNRYLFELTPTRTINGAIAANVARFINHGCRPNAFVEVKRRVFIKARRNIAAGEEILYDYGREYVKGWLKRCKCPHCRGTKRKAAQS